MNVDAQPNWVGSLPRHAVNSLALNNRRIAEGSEEVLVSPAYEDISDDDIKTRLNLILETITMTDTFRTMELANADKFGPRSIAQPWSNRRGALQSYFAHDDYDPGGFESTNGRLRPASALTTVDSLIKTSNSGLPYMQRKGSVLGDALINMDEQLGVYPAVLFTRTQEQGKTRNVWGFPISDTIAEQQFFKPWLVEEKKLPWRSALLGPEMVDAAMSQLLYTWSKGDIIYSVDFSAYDASISPEASYAAFSMIAEHFQAGYEPDLYSLFRRFVEIPIYTPDGEWSGPHGVPSGSSFTNTIDSLVQWIYSGGGYPCQIQGDDGVYKVPKGRVESFLERWTGRPSGLTPLSINESKSLERDIPECIYLQRYYSPAYPNKYGFGLGGIYSAFRAFNRIKYLERWTDLDKMEISGKDFFSLRTIMILENCKHHPAFNELVIMAHSLDKTGLSFTEAGLNAFSRAMDSKTRAGVFNRDVKTGINQFKTVQLLNKL